MIWWISLIREIGKKGTLLVFHSVSGKTHFIALSVLACALAPPVQAQSVALTNSRWASFSCIYTCFPQDTFQINLTITSSPPTPTYTIPSGFYQVTVGGSAYTTFTVNPDGTLANPDSPANPYVQTVIYGPSSNSGNFNVTIYPVANPSQIVYQDSISITNTFVWDFYWTFLSIQATYNYHTAMNYIVPLNAFLAPGPDANPNPQPLPP
jgi:hypothetical protein